jgi:hypothetical protein
MSGPAELVLAYVEVAQRARTSGGQDGFEAIRAYWRTRWGSGLLALGPTSHGGQPTLGLTPWSSGCALARTPALA